MKTGSYSAEVEKTPWIVLVYDFDLVCLVLKIGLNLLYFFGFGEGRQRLCGGGEYIASY